MIPFSIQYRLSLLSASRLLLSAFLLLIGLGSQVVAKSTGAEDFAFPPKLTSLLERIPEDGVLLFYYEDHGYVDKVNGKNDVFFAPWDASEKIGGWKGQSQLPHHPSCGSPSPHRVAPNRSGPRFAFTLSDGYKKERNTKYSVD